ncbi:Clo7bot family Cys-rich peptide [Fusibacter sp. JL216-2]
MKYVVKAASAFEAGYCYGCIKQDINKCDKQCFDKG